MTSGLAATFNNMPRYSSPLFQQVENSENPCESMQVHHLIPNEIWNALAIIHPGLPFELLAGGRNNPSNLMMLPSTSAGALASGFALHNGSHPNYTIEVGKKVMELVIDYDLAVLSDPVAANLKFALDIQELELSLRNKLNRNMPNEQLLLTSKDPFASQIPGGELAATIAMENMAERVNDVVSLVTGNPRAAYPNNSMANH